MGNFGDKLRQRREERKQTREQSKSTRREQRAGSNQPRQPRYGAGIFKGSLGEPNREPITQKNEDLASCGHSASSDSNVKIGD